MDKIRDDADRITVAHTKAIGKDGNICIQEQVVKRPIEVNLTIGVFFDGTGLNYENTKLRKQYQQALAQGEQPKIDFPIYDASYLSEYTNIYKLYDMYPDDADDEITKKVADKVDSYNPVRTAHYQIKVYIEGVGTETGKGDDNIGLATGFGDTGVDVKKNKAISEIKAKLKKLIDDNSKIRIQSIQYDVFGFSRGAATARYFSNFVADVLTDKKLKGANNPLTHMLKGTLNCKISDAWQGPLNGKVRFLGLFDTVAGLGGVTNMFDAGDANTFEIDICIRPETAESGLQIEAAHEYRHNFALNSVPDFFKKVVVPGAHSDIGGGYDNQDLVEKIYITDGLYETRSTFSTFELPKKQLLAKLALIQQHPELKYLFAGVNESHFRSWVRTPSALLYDNPTMVRQDYGVIRIERTVKFGLDQIALRIMYNEAIKQGCQFAPFLDKYDIPILLKPVANKIMAAAKAYQSYPLTEQEKQLVVTHYVHSSAEYAHGSYNVNTQIDIIDEKTGELKKINWQKKQELIDSDVGFIGVHNPHINSAGQWQRLVHAN